MNCSHGHVCYIHTYVYAGSCVVYSMSYICKHLLLYLYGMCNVVWYFLYLYTPTSWHVCCGGVCVCECVCVCVCVSYYLIILLFLQWAIDQWSGRWAGAGEVEQEREREREREREEEREYSWHSSWRSVALTTVQFRCVCSRSFVKSVARNVCIEFGWFYSIACTLLVYCIVVIVHFSHEYVRILVYTPLGRHTCIYMYI